MLKTATLEAGWASVHRRSNQTDVANGVPHGCGIDGLGSLALRLQAGADAADTDVQNALVQLRPRRYPWWRNPY